MIQSTLTKQAVNGSRADRLAKQAKHDRKVRSAVRGTVQPMPMAPAPFVPLAFAYSPVIAALNSEPRAMDLAARGE